MQLSDAGPASLGLEVSSRISCVTVWQISDRPSVLKASRAQSSGPGPGPRQSALRAVTDAGPGGGWVTGVVTHTKWWGPGLCQHLVKYRNGPLSAALVGAAIDGGGGGEPGGGAAIGGDSETRGSAFRSCKGRGEEATARTAAQAIGTLPSCCRFQ
eukprot:749728-Hanusia_phi.AAC.2